MTPLVYTFAGLTPTQASSLKREPRMAAPSRCLMGRKELRRMFWSDRSLMPDDACLILGVLTQDSTDALHSNRLPTTHHWSNAGARTTHAQLNSVASCHRQLSG